MTLTTETEHAATVKYSASKIRHSHWEDRYCYLTRLALIQAGTPARPVH